MLSYQHAFHAGNLADLQKHALLAMMLEYLIRKDKPVSYIETHSGRGLYNLSSVEATKTGEAAQGISRVEGMKWFSDDHPLAQAIAAIRDVHGAQSYPGSPLIARHILRKTDTLHLTELHPQEYAALRDVTGRGAKLYRQDGLELAMALTPPTPRRGLMLIDPSWEVKTDYTDVPKLISQVARKWNVGIIALWYPILASKAQLPMVMRLRAEHPDALIHEVHFPPAREGHGMIGSGMFILNPPWGIEGEAQRLSKLFATL
ncbi:protein involved in catabolism of external DNA [Thioclava sp. SK-1]|uniref:23S rRNA (adenine(2030)-N(6))-methyltransferase RlmJ n=1 Tax=Thioclava sp. SK-1 TaxID=1889770 RepID=UPI0008269C40|nr:23S rRNA (adenine(2030)-N(6))-methyltransferase RlmJ [Thioclava sp. SK-1]OCX66028.1 protein involved in catabolism of external DNA [Thioclava sp. SK-1]